MTQKWNQSIQFPSIMFSIIFKYLSDFWKSLKNQFSFVFLVMLLLISTISANDMFSYSSSLTDDTDDLKTTTGSEFSRDKSISNEGFEFLDIVKFEYTLDKEQNSILAEIEYADTPRPEKAYYDVGINVMTVAADHSENSTDISIVIYIQENVTSFQFSWWVQSFDESQTDEDYFDGFTSDPIDNLTHTMTGNSLSISYTLPFMVPYQLFELPDATFFVSTSSNMKHPDEESTIIDHLFLSNENEELAEQLPLQSNFALLAICCSLLLVKRKNQLGKKQIIE